MNEVEKFKIRVQLGTICNKIFRKTELVLLWLEWQHVSTLLSHHQAFVMNQLATRLLTFLGSQTMSN